MKKMALSGMLLLMAALAVVLDLEGCTSRVAGPKSQATPGERLSFSKEKAAVLLRMKGSIENKLFEEVPIMSGPEDKGFGISLKPQGGLAIPILVQLHRIDAAEVGQKGWLYFFIDPGDHGVELFMMALHGQHDGQGLTARYLRQWRQESTWQLIEAVRQAQYSYTPRALPSQSVALGR